MSLPAIPASNPTTIAPTAPIVYDSWWLKDLDISAGDPANVTVIVTMAKYRTLEDGTPDFSRIDQPLQFSIDHVMQQVDPQSPTYNDAIAAAVTALLTNLVIYAQSNKLI